MNFSVHFDEDTVRRLAEAVARTGVTRNRIIVTAVQDWLARNEEKDWPEALREHFRNPAPELAQESLDAESWRRVLSAETPVTPAGGW
jgi:hypothetical protein